MMLAPSLPRKSCTMLEMADELVRVLRVLVVSAVVALAVLVLVVFLAVVLDRLVERLVLIRDSLVFITFGE